MYRLKSPLAAQVELTESCNNLCRHCYNYWRFQQSKQQSSRKCLRQQDQEGNDKAHRIIDILIEQGVMSVTLTGGEPFLQRKILYEIIGKSKSAGQRVSINTNAALVTRNDAARIKAADVDLVVVSLLSHNAETHDAISGSKSHAKTIRALGWLSAAEVPLLVNMVVSTLNYKDVLETARAVKMLGINSFAATPVLACTTVVSHSPELLLSAEGIKRMLDSLLAAKEAGMYVDVLEPIAHCAFTADERKKYEQFLCNRTCSAGISDAVISPNGDLRPCILSEEVVGNILEEGWSACWDKLEQWRKPTMLPKECLQCALVDNCGGGCRVAALAMNGQITAKDPYMTTLVSKVPLVVQDSHAEPLPMIDSSCTLAFPPAFVARTESFGGIIGTAGKVMFLHKDAFAFIKALIAKNAFSIKSIISEFNVDEQEAVQLLSLLLAKGFVITTSGKERR